MALKADLNIDNKTYNIIECDYEFTQIVDHQTGRPSDRPRGGIINVILSSPGDADLKLHEWMRDKNTSKNGTITLTVNVNNIDVPKTIKFENAYCIRLYEYFNNTNSVQMYTKISILAGTITFGSNCHFTMFDK
ncbi:MAG: type VI secretion system tube protein TssD [Bacteroidales bacterium]